MILVSKNLMPHNICVTRWTKQAFPCSKFLSPGGGGVSFGQIQHFRGLNSIALGYLNFTARLTLFLFIKL